VIVVDVQPVYPPSLIPAWMSGISDFYVTTYHDKFFIEKPPFFEFWLWTELLIQIPVEIWAIGGLLRSTYLSFTTLWKRFWGSRRVEAHRVKDSPMVPLVLLPFSCLIFITTATCMFEYAHWDAPLAQKLDLTTLYGPYAALCKFQFFIGVNWFESMLLI